MPTADFAGGTSLSLRPCDLQQQWQIAIMQQVTHRSFGLLISHIIPGFIALLGLGQVLPTIRGWLNATASGSGSVTVSIYVVFVSIALGMVASAVRFLVIDRILLFDGLRRPAWNDRHLQENLAAYQFLGGK